MVNYFHMPNCYITNGCRETHLLQFNIEIYSLRTFTRCYTIIIIFPLSLSKFELYNFRGNDSAKDNTVQG